MYDRRDTWRLKCRLGGICYRCGKLHQCSKTNPGSSLAPEPLVAPWLPHANLDSSEPGSLPSTPKTGCPGWNHGPPAVHFPVADLRSMSWRSFGQDLGLPAARISPLLGTSRRCRKP